MRGRVLDDAHQGLCYLLLMVAGMTAGCAPRGETPAAAAPPQAAVEYVTLRAERTDSAIELPGSVVPTRSVSLTAPLGGQVRFLAEEGARVTADSRIAELEAPGLAKQESAARASVDAAERRRAGSRTAIRQAETEGDLAGDTLAQTLRAAEAERERRKQLLSEAELQAQTEPARLQAAVSAAEAHVRLLKSGERQQRIRQLEAGLDVARAELDTAKTQLRRTRQLYGEGFVSRTDLEGAVLTVKRADSNVTAHEEELKLQKEGQHPEAIAEAEHQAEMARQALNASQNLVKQVAERKAELEGAEAEAARAQRSLENARTNRLSVTRARDEAAVSEAEARRAHMEYLEAQERLAQSVVRAPFTGQVVRRQARPGETVTPGAPLLELVDPAALQFEATVSDAEVARVRMGDRVRVSVPAAGRGSQAGRVAEIIQAADKMQRGYRVKVSLERAAGLRSGMIGTAKLGQPSAKSRISLPVTALRRYFPSESRAEVLVLVDDRPEAREVRTAAPRGDRLEILSGLRPGERVVVSDPRSVVLSQPVQAREVSQP